MKKTQYFFCSLLLAGTGVATSCSTDEYAPETGEGYISLTTVDVDKKVQNRATNDQIAVDILNGDGSVFKHADDWTTIQGEAYLVNAGTTYTIKAYSYGKTVAEGFTAEPVYSGEEAVTVKAGVNQTVDVTCKLEQAMVSVTYSDNFKSKFKDYKAILTSANGLALTYTSTETRPAYVKAGQKLEIMIMGAVNAENGKSFVFSNVIAEDAQPAHRYNVHYDVNTEGSSTIDIAVDPTIHEYEITLGVPLEPDGVATTAIAGDYSRVWGQFAYLAGQCTLVSATDPVEFKYKKTSESTWNTVTATPDAVGSTGYSAKITALDFGTEYQYKIVCGEEEGDVLSFTTEAFEEIPNLNFDTWSSSGKNYYANADAADSYWASGNSGVTIMKNANTVPVEGADARNGKAAKLNTYDNIALVGAAAGNLFIGTYSTNMSNPSASAQFGRPYTGARPLRLTGYYKYAPADITKGSVPGNLTKDECHVYVKVWDAAGNEIANGEFFSSEEVTTYKPFTVDFNYTDKTKPAAKITIVISSSHYGGEFNGSKVVGQVGPSTMWVDDFELSYY